MALIKRKNVLYWESHYGRCPDRKCPDGSQDITVCLETEKGLLAYCGYCGKKLKTWKRLRKV